jgi:hypothetical protein
MKKILFFLASLSVFCLLSAGSSWAAEEKQLKTSVVTIRGYEGVAPLNLFISPGTIVVWVNDYKQAPVEVKFPLKKVTLACQSPVNFIMSKEGTFVSNPIPYGGVASLCFIEQGTFDYFIERSRPAAGGSASDRFRFEGKIIVKAQ